MFLRKAIIVLTLFAAIVYSPQDNKSQAYLNVYDTNPTSSLPLESLFTFVAQENGARGRAFIANNFIFSASHLYDKEYKPLDHDIVNMGPTTIKGGEIDFKVMKEDEFLFYWTNDRSLIPMRIIEVKDSSYTIMCRPIYGKIIPGDSGTPVFNTRGKIVGIISSIWIGTNGSIGNIERFLEEDLKYTAPSSNG